METQSIKRNHVEALLQWWCNVYKCDNPLHFDNSFVSKNVTVTKFSILGD